MSVTAQQRLLYLLAGTCLVAAAWVVYWSMAEFPPPRQADSGATDQQPGFSSASGSSSRSDVDLARPLRGPLYDPPPQPPRKPPVAKPVRKPQPAPPPKLNFTLVGTIIDDDQRLAIIADAKGNFDVKGVGEALELQPAGVRIDQIEQEEISVEFEGVESKLRLDRDVKPAAGSTRGGGNRRRNR